MEIEDFQALLAPQGQEALEMAVARAPREEDFLGHFTALSRRFPAALARAALEQAILRLEASPKFPFAARMYFTRQALEQATSYQISTYRAGRFHPFSRLLDLGCSLGGDTLSLCQVAPTIGVDLDALRLALAQANLQALGLQERVAFLCADLNKQLPMRIGRDTGVFFDPARRTQTRRVYSVHDYQPALSSIQSWLMDAPALGVKISPGVKLEELAPYEAEVEFISLDGELKEAVLWFGSLKSARRRATLLPG